MFHQVLNPLGNMGLTLVAALIPVVLLLFLMAVVRMTAWLTVVISSVVTVIIAIVVWHVPFGTGMAAYWWGGLTGIWAVDWITFWGVVMYYTLNYTGLFEIFRKWLIQQATADVRVQAILLAWAFGALLEGLVGFGYPWAVVGPILMTLGIADLDALRVTAIANNAPVSYGAMGAPIITLAAVTGLPLMSLSASVGNIVAVLALAPPWILIYLVAGRKGIKDAWPLAIVASLSYILGQWPVAHYLGPYLPDISGAIVSFVCILLFLKVWRPKQILGYGGKEVDPASIKKAEGEALSSGDVFKAWLPFVILVVVVLAGTGPWSKLPGISLFMASVKGLSSITHKPVAVAFNWNLFAGGTWILISWLIVVLLFANKSFRVLGEVFKKTFAQMWGALLVGFFIFGLANLFNFSGMASSLAYGFSKVGPVYIILSPILGWIGVALSGSNTSTNAMFGGFQAMVGKLLGAPVLLFPSLNSVGAEVGKPVAPQTASVGVSTTGFTRNEGEVIRHNMGWTLIALAYLIVIGVLYYVLAPGTMRL
ncbi:glycolate permease GlcA [Peptococcaceae bacterium CEB3]|nr:glycolate permease GlcA [Peptococcaceae bacterium CEB3]